MIKTDVFLKENHHLKVIPFVDVCSVSKSFFSRAEVRISTYELKNNGIVLKGENFLRLLPEINTKSYNSKVNNSIKSFDDLMECQSQELTELSHLNK